MQERVSDAKIETKKQRRAQQRVKSRNKVIAKELQVPESHPVSNNNVSLSAVSDKNDYFSYPAKAVTETSNSTDNFKPKVSFKARLQAIIEREKTNV